MKIPQRLQQYIFESQTIPLAKNASFLKKILVIVYKLLGRKIIAKLLISSDRCNGCKVCVDACPNNAIKLRLKNPRRNNRCKGCLFCVYSCPKQAFELPLCSLIGAFLLIFLPYDEWMLKLISFSIASKIGSMFVSFLLWCIGYAVVVYLFEKVIFLVSTTSVFKKFGAIPSIRKMRNKLHPALIFPIIISRHSRDSNIKTEDKNYT